MQTTYPLNRVLVKELAQQMLCMVDITAGALLDEGHSMKEIQAALIYCAQILPELQAELEAED